MVNVDDEEPKDEQYSPDGGMFQGSFSLVNILNQEYILHNYGVVL
jgi:hypothetical protein